MSSPATSLSSYAQMTSEKLGALLRGTWRDLTWRRSVLVGFICFVTSSQVLFNASILDGLTVAELSSGWLSNFLDTLVAGACIGLAVTIADNALPEESWWRLVGFPSRCAKKPCVTSSASCVLNPCRRRKAYKGNQ